VSESMIRMATIFTWLPRIDSTAIFLPEIFVYSGSKILIIKFFYPGSQYIRSLILFIQALLMNEKGFLMGFTPQITLSFKRMAPHIVLTIKPGQVV
jgi:hypothetical protein